VRELGNSPFDIPIDLLAVDGGGSKVDVALVGRDGVVLGAARGTDGLEGAVAAACSDAGLDPANRPIAQLGMFCLAGADLPADDERIQRELVGDGWSAETVLRNDTFAVLRAGTTHGWGVALVCGTGINCTAVGPDGRTFRFPAIGSLSGDWGGGYDIGSAALWHAVRAEDGRGPDTLLATDVPAHFGLTRPLELVEAIHLGQLSRSRVAELPPVVFAAAAAGDGLAATIVERQADEIVLMAVTAIRKVGLAEEDGLEVVLGGGIFHNGDPGFVERIREGIGAPVRVTAEPPLVGAVLLGLDRLGVTAADAALRRTLTHGRLQGLQGG
jgi:N-acetylglucosamine kinase-like BadF-type ATPase